VIADTADLHIQANVEETYVAQLQIGQAVTVTIDALGRQRFNGYIAEIGRITDNALTGEMMAFTTTGRFTKVTQLLPVRINIIDDLDLSGFIGLNAGIRVRLRGNINIVENVVQNSVDNSANQIIARGTVESVEQRNIYSVLGHKVDRIFVEVGDTVSRNQTLATLDDGDLMPTLARQQAELALQNARTALETARIYHASLSALYEAGGISQIELLQAENALSFAQNRYNDAQSQLRTARHNVGRQSVISPIDGVVTARFVREGAIANGLLFVVEDVDNLRIRTIIREYDIAKIHVRMPVTIISDATGNEYVGKISRIFPTAMKNERGETACFSVVNFEVEVAVVSENVGFRIGMNARVRINLEN
jgi:RND family efflux transporter MFP subunit